MIDVKIANVEDIVTCCGNAVDESVRAHPENWVPWSQFKIATGPAYSFCDGTEMLACMGLHIRREGVADVWAVFARTPRLRRLGVLRGLLSTSRTFIEVLAENYELTRIRSFSIKGFEKSQKWLEACGFKRLRRESDTKYFYRWAS